VEVPKVMRIENERQRMQTGRGFNGFISLIKKKMISGEK